MKVCIIGLGLMGSALARRLKSCGYDLVLYNRTPSKAVQLASEFNAKAVDTPLSCCRESNISVLFVADDNAVIDVAFTPTGIIKESKGKDIVNMSTVSTSISERLGSAVEFYGGRYVEAPVYGSVSEVIEGRLTAIVASNSEISDGVKELLNCVAKKILYVGRVPGAAALKLALNQLNMAVIAAFAESLAFLKAYSIEFELFEELLRGTWMEPIVARYMKRSLEEHPPRFRLEMAAKDLQCFIESARAKQLSVHVSAAAMQRYLEASMHGYSDKDYPNIGKYLVDVVKKRVS